MLGLPTFRLKLRNTGRGRGYTRGKALVEAAKQVLFLGGWPTALWGRLPGATEVRLVRRTLPLLPQTAEGRPPLRLALATDLHLGACTHPRTLESAFEKLRVARPDVLLLGGDYVYHDASRATARRLGELVASVPAATKLAVWGNHDLWTRQGRLEQALVGAGARLLVNDAAPLPAPWDDVAVVGLDDTFAGDPDLARAKDATSALAPELLVALCHDSDHAPQLARLGARLHLSGHTHGGQIALPGGTPIVSVGRFGRRYSAGWHRLAVDGQASSPLHLFVSRGVGAVGLPARLFAPADVALITLTEV